MNPQDVVVSGGTAAGPLHLPKLGSESEPKLWYGSGFSKKNTHESLSHTVGITPGQTYTHGHSYSSHTSLIKCLKPDRLMKSFGLKHTFLVC